MRNTCQPFTNINVNDATVGVDGCKGGWLAVVLESQRNLFAIETFPTWEILLQKLTGAVCIAVDMPIGLVTHGKRHCDRLARMKLGRGRASSVFSPPRRPMLAFESYGTANEWGKANVARDDEAGGLSKQSWNITPKIKEIDSLIRPEDQNRIIEAHPEPAFQKMNGGLCPNRKKTAEGIQQRHDLLRQNGFEDLHLCLNQLSNKQASVDDLLDACALSLVAERKIDGTANCLAGEPLHDDRGLRMEIWY